MSNIAGTSDCIKTEELLRDLIRFNTTNPPGNEADCIRYIEKILKEYGIQTITAGANENRLNLIARIKGRGEKQPLLMYGHIDVVSAEHQDWKYDPFEGIIADDCVWGRGALDMKGAVAMMICAMVRMKKENIVPAGDIILAVLSDEEDEGYFGGNYIVENYADLFKDVQFAIGEIGGFTMHLSGKKFYPIMVAEKQRCSIRTVIKGPGGHGSMPMHDGSMARLGKILSLLNEKRLPVHVTEPSKMMIKALSENMPFPASTMLSKLLDKKFTDKVIKIMGSSGRLFDPILHNTVNATIVKGGNKINVIPSEIELEFDGRLLPGFTKEDMLSELSQLIGKDLMYEVTYYCQGPQRVNMELFGCLSDIIKEGDGEAIPIPFVVSGVTDARFFAKLGIQTYGFTPMLLTRDMDFSSLIHSANERIPINALEFGVDSIYKLLKRF